MNAEQQRAKDTAWKKWGPYVSNRQWGVVREDYSPEGDPWTYCSFDAARSKAYRWGEEGIAGICDDQQLLCFSVALWNKKDPFIKEIFFGLANGEGNHGEDVKEQYYYLDNTPSHAYMKLLYKYPQREFPYSLLKEENKKRTLQDPEFELMDTGIFDDNAYFDVFVEYAKASPEDILVRITVHNRGAADAALSLLPLCWFRNTWAWNKEEEKPRLFESGNGQITIKREGIKQEALYYEEATEALFCENETNSPRLYHARTGNNFYKDGINDYLVNGSASVNPDKSGARAAVHYDRIVKAGGAVTVRLRLCRTAAAPFSDFDDLFRQRIKEADEFYESLQGSLTSQEDKLIQRQAFAGLLWNKQFYYYNIREWLKGDPGMPAPPASRLSGRNFQWKHLNCKDIISMPDKWEYPWFAAWDLAFHCVVLARLDIGFAKEQLQLLTKEWYMHPDGCLPAYEWDFGDANPPLHAWAAWEVYRQEKEQNGAGDLSFLKAMFHKLLLCFTWWVNKKDLKGNNIFEGGFLGLDNIGVFDRDAVRAGGAYTEQADGTSWMAMFALNMLHIALELATYDKVYTDMANKFFEHFLYVAGAINSMGGNILGLWDEEDEFYYDQLLASDKSSRRLKVRSIVGLIPLFAVEVLDKETLQKNPAFAERMEWFLKNRPDLATQVSRWNEEGPDEKHLLSLLRGHRMKRLLSRMLDEEEFLSPYGVRALSRYYKAHPYHFTAAGKTLTVNYVPGDSDSRMFGGNSNWRGPVWMPVNFLIIQSLRRFHRYYSSDFKVEYPTHSNDYLSLNEIADRLADRLKNLFRKDESGRRVIFGNNDKLNNDPHFRDYVLFYEYFHGDDGHGLGASHQTGWTALITALL